MSFVRCKPTRKILGEAASYAVHTINRCPHTANQFLTPEEKWTKQPPNLDNLKVIGCVGYVI